MLARVSSTPTFKRLPRAVREQQMLDAAVKVFSRRGFHAASMDEIADDAGISKPMVYAYLGTKEELFIACLHRESTRMMEAIAGAAAPDLPADERLWRGLRAFFGFVGAHRDGWAVLYRQARGSQPFAAELAAMRGRLVEVVAGMLDHALRAAGREVGATDLEVVSYALVGASESLADWLADHPEADAGKTATRMMNVAWLGADQLLRGATWHPGAV
ncbi:TetR/AcrR family transcriptional regulator [Micromonospora chalcea]|uniref:TetR/AcrR family transcriptional regulator n=1 Tax=Micromonospora chalcea TaxID=1874 RepID=A0ABX9Y9G8_MICCH|nr:TetR/AcrR family transcriptional regulator [Micromonospora sp. CMU55-4]ODB79565.1 TetR family transcriptional regulator [Micromonospora sp. II]PPA60296.1 TetR family transcriptional regulator [Micromonospora chalcea]RBQ13514.1 TetR/AcrR family transcriptional regulator [Micromonospora sp. LHW51205]RQW97184.1 TetR/AcrR family transcriptional regulator [Micromonospora chalcea]